MILNYLRLYRIDAFLITFLSYLVGATVANNFSVMSLVVALLVAGISVNFIYSYNSWADWKIDQINKPNRPIPAGLISPQSAFYYAVSLLVLSIIYPFFIYKNLLTLGLFLLLPIIGLLYSTEPIRLKKNKFGATFTTSLLLTIPISLSYLMHTDDRTAIPCFLILFGYCLSVIPLKDIEDVEGDVTYKSDNWMAQLGSSKLFLLSISGLLLNLLLIFLLPIIAPLSIYLSIFILSTMLVVAFFFLFIPQKLNLLYKSIIWMVIFEGSMAFLITYFFI